MGGREEKGRKKFLPQIHTDLHRWFIGFLPPVYEPGQRADPMQAIHTKICANLCVSVAKISFFSLNYPGPVQSTLGEKGDAEFERGVVWFGSGPGALTEINKAMNCPVSSFTGSARPA